MAILQADALEFITRSADQTCRLGMRLGKWLQPGDVLALEGDLGGGKTTFVQGLAAGWGSTDAVSSPTFVVVNVYQRGDGARLYHVDAYRLSGAAEAWDLDIPALAEEAPLVVEWADVIAEALPAERLTVRFVWLGESQRALTFYPQGERPRALVRSLRAAILRGV
ncbi:MAG TPA: tRNA (adenosine(37)-N6)-threonylcarbamoyltransferase complex ATPase subunit type 1 TsaE [Chloroflexi bacterium]|nr:tRNA (adenosine(37)-N6)-threonylcarbamoyltransferase complex ATPase subunit type 1 TsaE [Chloroflexota bacterium]